MTAKQASPTKAYGDSRLVDVWAASATNLWIIGGTSVGDTIHVTPAGEQILPGTFYGTGAITSSGTQAGSVARGVAVLQTPGAPAVFPLPGLSQFTFTAEPGTDNLWMAAASGDGKPLLYRAVNAATLIGQ